MPKTFHCKFVFSFISIYFFLDSCIIIISVGWQTEPLPDIMNYSNCSKKNLLHLNEVDSIGIPLEIQSSLFVLGVVSRSYCKSL